MHTVASFHAGSVSTEQLRTVTAAYMALERARVYRRLFVTRFGLLAAVPVVIGLGFRWMTLPASWFSIALCAVVPLAAWIAELRCGRRLAKALKVIKSS